MIKVGVIFGGETVEHEISIISALQLKNKYKGKYKLTLCYLKNGEKLLVRISGTELYKQLSEFDCFYRCGRAHIINLNHISRVTLNGVTFKNAIGLALPRAVLTGLRSAFFDYFN